jgi:hypothetical protein
MRETEFLFGVSNMEHSLKRTAACIDPLLGNDRETNDETTHAR